jgi:methylmalonyl-CoA mutase C-terminal domain/subunit
VSEPIRVLVAKPGLDGHDRGAKVVARGLRDAGFEVIYTGLHRTPAQIVRAAVDEDVHVVGLSILSGAHDRLVPEVLRGLREAGREDVVLLVGGIIPEADVAGLAEIGVRGVFPPGSSIDDIVSFIRQNVEPRW